MRYGEDYKTPCEKFAIDILNDAATKHDANSFFTQTDQISQQMMQALNTTMETECFSSIQFFQLSGVDLPNKFEDAISETQIRDQDIITANADKNNVGIELITAISKAQIQQSVAINEADAIAQADVQKNSAAMQSFYDIVTRQSSAYSLLKSSLNMNNDQLVKYVRAQAINEYNQKDIVVSLPSRK